MDLFKGVGVALVTPFKNGKVNYEKLEELINFHIENKTDAIIILGTTGEASTITEEEKMEIVLFSIKKANKKIPIIVGSGSNCTDSTISFSKFANDSGADGLLIVTPYYNKPSQKGLIAHYTKIAQEVDIPIIIYNVPSRTGVNILPHTVYELSKVNNIKGIKEASGDIHQISKIIDICGKDFYVYSGNDDQLIPVLALGGSGVISVTANIIPGRISKIIKAFYNNDIVYAIGEALNLEKLHHSMFIETNPLPVKTAMNLMNMEVGELRLPLVEMDGKNIDVLKQILKEYDLV